MLCSFNRLKQGPLNKGLYTQIFELLLKCFIRAQNSVTFRVVENTVLLYVESFEFNLSALLERTHFSHLFLNQSDSEAFLPSQNNAEGYLTLAEQKCLYDWSESAFNAINQLLYDPALFCATSSLAHILNTLITIGFIASGLNKIDQPLNASVSLFRGEAFVKEDEIALRKKLIAKKGGISKHKGYMATSTSWHIASLFSEAKSLITYENAGGKSIIGYSPNHEEEECLFLPNTTIFWKKHTLSGGVHHFKASVVEPLIAEEETLDATVKMLDDVIDIAESKGISIDSLTLFARNELTKYPTKYRLREAVKKGELPGVKQYGHAHWEMLASLNSLNQSALHLAALSNQIVLFHELFKLLKNKLDKKGDILQQQDSHGLSPLDYLVMMHQKEHFLHYESETALKESKLRVLRLLLRGEITSCLHFLKHNPELVESALQNPYFLLHIKTPEYLLALFAINPQASFSLLEKDKFKRFIIKTSKKDKSFLHTLFSSLPSCLKNHSLMKEIMGESHLVLHFTWKSLIHYLRYHFDKKYRELEQERLYQQWMNETPNNPIKTANGVPLSALSPPLRFSLRQKENCKVSTAKSAFKYTKK